MASWTKQTIIQEAFGELGLQGYVFNVGPEELLTGLNRLDMMMATWNGKGIRLGYPLPSNSESSALDQDSGLPDSALEAAVLNLAIRLCGNFGKVPPPLTQRSAIDAYNTLLARAAMPMEMQWPGTLPRGAGQKPWRFQRPFFPTPVDPLLAGQDGPIEFD